jgi:hypothetical protein
MYYDCIEACANNSWCAARGAHEIHSSRICLATSVDGVTWIKPSLGMFTLNGSSVS